jgi:hypothetical protein
MRPTRELKPRLRKVIEVSVDGMEPVRRFEYKER